MQSVGLRNYIKLFTEDEVVWIAFRNIFYMIVISFIFMLPIALLLANSLSSVIRGNRFYSVVFYMPCIISTIMIALMWSAIFNTDIGPINSILKAVHLDFLAMTWLGDPKITIFVVIFVNTWQYVGYHMLIFLTSLQAIPESIFEASRIDGAGGFMKLIYITVPLLKESIKLNSILVVIGSFKAFDLVYAMTSGGPADSTQMLATYMYHNTFRRFNFGYGSAIAMTIFILSITTSLIQQKILAVKED